ncbi:helix-turn-helix domain-containing protein [Streptomyces sp. NBC_01216]|uniref:helix-turn-helix domain-containing protein n=1 Tax=Streptomyces sp. NBC_01216 TaxID=2903778 RepID=UPI002E0F9EB5|nr:helix-turn-helix domain-containing protein [Streptomyces sp. NBC_01216]
MPAKPTPPPEATLLRLAREAANLSPESAAARMAGRFSGSRWRQIEAGYRRDSENPVIAPAPTLAQMASTLGVKADRLEAAGRADAAEILREIESAGSPAPAPTATQAALAELEEWQQQIILKALDNRPRSKREKALLLRTLAEHIEQQDESGQE